MDHARTPSDAAELLAHLGWVRRLAAALVRDAATADDLAQDALRVTLEQPRGRVGTGAAMNACLGGVVRRHAVDRFRAEKTRAARERQLAPREPAGDPFEIVARSARQQQVAQAVSELSEPYRSTVLYRYLDELSTREVAARMSVSEVLVRKRLERGLAQLRERLDREFGASTKAWAVALLSWPGVAAVTMKTKVAIAALLLGGAALTWNVIDDRAPRADDGGAPGATPAVVAATEPVSTSGAEGAARPLREAESSRSTAAPVAAASVVHVRVVDPDGRACTEGRIFGFSGQGATDPHVPLRSFARAIDGEITTIEFPRAAGCLLIAASVPGLLTSTRQGASWPDELWKSPAERIERELTIEVGRPLPAPKLEGRILVDGTPSVPRGLAIDVVELEDPLSAEHCVRIHALAARYEIGPRPAGDLKLWITSDETEPKLVEIDADDTAVDLALMSARTLLLTVLDRATDAPLPGLELHLRSNVKVAKSLLRETWRDASQFFTTGADGVARVTGIPRDGTIEIRRDASSTKAPMTIGGQTFTIQRMREPLLDLRLAPKDPAVIERTIRIDREDGRATIRGRLAEPLRARLASDLPRLEVHWALIGDDDRPKAYDDSLQLDADDGFAIAVDRHHDYFVWAEHEALRFTEIARVRVGDGEPPPLELAPRRGGEILLRLVRCPAEGSVSVFAPDAGGLPPRASVFDAKGGTMERRIPVDGPTTIDVGWVKERGGDSGKRRAVAVDPATTPVVEVDLQGDLARAVSLDLGDVAMPEQSQLWLLQLAAGDVMDSQAAMANRVAVRFRGNESSGPVVIDPGRYLAVLIGAPGIVGGVVEVASGSRNAPVAFHLEVEEHPRATLGAGIRVEKIGGVALDPALVKAFTIRFADAKQYAQADPFLLPADCEFTLLPE